MFRSLFSFYCTVFKDLNAESIYVIDTFPIPACDNWRIRRKKRYTGEAYRGYDASKRRPDSGIKIHLLVTSEGEPVEFFLTPGGYSDTKGLQGFEFALPAGAEVFGDKAYNDYEIEDVLAEAEIHLIPIRKKNSHRPLPPWKGYIQAVTRKAVETAGSLIDRLKPLSIHAVTPEGFELTVVLFVLAFSINCL